MKTVRAKFESAHVVPVSGIGKAKSYDDNVIRVRVKVWEGPEAFVDRMIWVDIGITDLVKLLPVDTAISLYRELIRLKVDRMSETVKS